MHENLNPTKIKPVWYRNRTVEKENVEASNVSYNVISDKASLLLTKYSRPCLSRSRPDCVAKSTASHRVTWDVTNSPVVTTTLQVNTREPCLCVYTCI